ncbi:MAG: phosphoglycerate kinase [Pseudomonadota bacterium]
MKYKKITDLQLKNKIIFLRTDMNVPILDVEISDNTRMTAGLTTIKYALEQGAKLIIATHLGRPTEGQFDADFSVAIIAKNLAKLLNMDVPVLSEIPEKINFSHSNIVMLENVRFNVGEKSNDSQLGKKYANLCDIFVHDAFAASHRKEASTDAVGYHTDTVCAGLLMIKELEALTSAVTNPQSPVVAIVAGSKVSTKLNILKNLAHKVDYLIVGGGILNTFLLATNHKVGKSLVEKELVNEAKQIIEIMNAKGKVIPLPEEVITAKHFSPNEIAVEKSINSIEADDMILDVGANFANKLSEVIETAKTIIWNGPIGVFEFDQFANGTKVLAHSIANSKAFSLAGGGDTIAAINKFALMHKISYVSTAGGALLEFLEDKELPAITLLTRKN